MLKRIEFVCTANNGKSPIALAVAKDYLGNDPSYSLSSSGTMVDVITKSDGRQLSKYLSQFMGDARDRDILTESDLEELEKYPRKILEKFLVNERLNRDKYLGELGLQFIDYPSQTHSVEERGIVACIGNSNLRRVKEIYNGLTYSPEIVNLLGEDYCDIGNKWILTYDEFRDIARVVRESTIRLFDLNK